MKIFYGWRVVGAGALLQVLQGGLMQQSFGAYVAVLAAERGWSKTALSGGSALMSLETALIGPLIGWLVDRFGERRVIQAGVVIFALGLMAFGTVESIAGYYLALGACAIGMTFCGYFPINVAVIHWFERHRARALSTVGLGVAFGGIMVPMVALFMQAFGWRATAFASGLLVLIAGLPLSRVFKGRPHELGEHVDGIAPKPPEAGAAGPGADAMPSTAAREVDLERAQSGAVAAIAQPNFSIAEAMRTRAFWLLSLGHGAALLVVTAVNVHAITHMKEGLGYSVNQASLIIMVMTLSQIAGVLLGIWIGDRFPKRWVAAFAMLGHFFGLLLLTYAAGVAMLVGFAVLHGMAWGVRGPFMQAIRADYFGRQAIGMILGMSSIVVAMGQVGGPLIAGGLADLTGNYQLGFTLLAVVSLAGAWSFIAAKPPVHPSLKSPA
jgi:MFS family permease